MSQAMKKLPFAANYSFLCLFTTSKVNIFHENWWTPLDYLRAINYLVDQYELYGPAHETKISETLDHILSNLVMQGSKNMLDLRTIIEEGFKYKFDCIIDKKVNETEETMNKLMPFRRVAITPSKIEVEFPTLSMPNRAIRTHRKQGENFLRVSFQTEDHNRGMYRDDDDPVLKHIKDIMLNGFDLCGKKFKFLHYSNSQMRSHSCWFMHETENLKYEDFIKTLGDFNNCKLVSKNASRKGQAFSSAIKAATLEVGTDLQEIDDIKTFDDKYTFTDGIGYIEPTLLNKIAFITYKYPVISAIQIRMGGYKGVLMGCNMLEMGVKVYARPSMRKFEMDDKKVDLEVVRLATYAAGYLSKQIIVMLWANGVDSTVMLNMQKWYVDELIA